MARGQKLNHKKYMLEAIKIAEKGIKKGQTPFGAVIVDKKTGEIIAKAHNTVIKDNNPTAHAEINAIKKAGKKLSSYKFKDLVIYSTCEPCPMCFSAIHWSGIEEVYFGATIEDSKSIGFNEIMLHNTEMKKYSRRSIKIKVHEKFMGEECKLMMKSWKKNNEKRLY